MRRRRAAYHLRSGPGMYMPPSYVAALVVLSSPPSGGGCVCVRCEPSLPVRYGLVISVWGGGHVVLPIARVLNFSQDVLLRFVSEHLCTDTTQSSPQEFLDLYLSPYRSSDATSPAHRRMRAAAGSSRPRVAVACRRETGPCSAVAVGLVQAATTFWRHSSRHAETPRRPGDHGPGGRLLTTGGAALPAPSSSHDAALAS